MLFMTLHASLIISVHKIRNFMHFSQKRDIHTDERTDGRTDKEEASKKERSSDLKIFYQTDIAASVLQ